MIRYATETEPARNARVAIVASSFALIVLVGYVDGRTSAYIAFSIFYLIPVALATWFGNRTVGVLAAVACASTGLAADLWSIGAARTEAFANLGLRLILFVSVVAMLTRLKGALLRERELLRREREIAERLEETNALNEALMRAVAAEARAPIGDIYAKVVTLGFSRPSESDGSKEILDEIAQASLRLSTLVKLLQTRASGGSVASPQGRPRAS